MNRAEEIAKYPAAYRNSDYRMGKTRFADVIRVLSTLEPGSLLDVGTGRGETLTLAKDYKHNPRRGTEVVPYLLKPPVIVYAEAHALPFADGEFDHVTCFDVLEHLVLEDIAPALREFYRVARKSVTVSASWKPHSYHGVQLHPSAMPAEDWHKLIVDTWGGGYRYGNAGKFSGCWQVKKSWQ